jgi:hypothetical protein
MIGAGLGAIAFALIATVVFAALPPSQYRVEAVLEPTHQLPNPLGPGESPGPSGAVVRAALLNREFLTRVAGDSRIAGLDTLRHAADPVRVLEEHLSAEDPRDGFVILRLTGTRPEELRVIVDTLVKMALDDLTAIDRARWDERTRRLEQLAEQFRKEILSREQSIARLAEANGVAGGESADAKITRMQSELARLDAETAILQKEVQDLEVVLLLLQKKLAAGRFDLNPVELRQLADSEPRVGDLTRSRAAKHALLEREKRVGANLNSSTVKALEAEMERLDADLADARLAAEPSAKASLERAAEAQLRNRIADTEDKLGILKGQFGLRRQYREEFQKALPASIHGGLDISRLLKELEPLRDDLRKIESQRVMLRVEKELGPRVGVREGSIVLHPPSGTGRVSFALAAGIVSYLVIFLCAATTRAVLGP